MKIHALSTLLRVIVSKNLDERVKSLRKRKNESVKSKKYFSVLIPLANCSCLQGVDKCETSTYEFLHLFSLIVQIFMDKSAVKN